MTPFEEQIVALRDYLLRGGFLVVDELAVQLGARWASEPRFSALVARTELGGRRVLLAKALVSTAVVTCAGASCALGAALA